MDWGSLLGGVAGLFKPKDNAGGGGGSDTASSIMPLIQAGLGVAGNIGSGAAAGRTAQNNAAAGADALRLKAQGDQEAGVENRAKIDIAQKQEQRDALNNAYQQALRSAVALNMGDVHVNAPPGVHVTEFSGGLRPSALGTQGHAAAQSMNDQALRSLMNPEQLASLPPMQTFTPTPYQQPGAMENILGAAGAVGKVADATQARTDAAKQSDLIKQLLAANAAMTATKPQTAYPQPYDDTSV